jgi:hypothetical protein
MDPPVFVVYCPSQSTPCPFSFCVLSYGGRPVRSQVHQPALLRLRTEPGDRAELNVSGLAEGRLMADTEGCAMEVRVLYGN